MKIYVSNLAFGVADADLESLFAEHGAVTSAKVIMDRETGRSRGFGFVEMANDDEGNTAIRNLNNQSIENRNISVSIAKDKSQLGGGGSFGSGGNSSYKKRW